MAKKTNPLLLIDFGLEKVFDTATVDTNILMVSNAENIFITRTCQGRKGCLEHLGDFVSKNIVIDSYKDNSSWVTTDKNEKLIKEKICNIGKELSKWNISINRGILTGYNDAFYINDEIKEKIIESDVRSAELIHPIIRGKDISRYMCDFSDLYIINTHNGIKSRNIPRVKVEDYPAIKKHLDQFYDKLEPRYDQGDTPYNLRNCKFLDEMKKTKIAYRQISENMDASLLPADYFVNDKCYFITGDHLVYLLSVFNSTLFNKIIMQDANLTGGKGEAFLSKIHIPVPTVEVEKRFEDLYSERKNGGDSYIIDKQVDAIIYELFGLDSEEIAYLEREV